MFENIDEKTVKFTLLILVIVIIFSIPFAVISSKTPSSNMVNTRAVNSEKLNNDTVMEEENNIQDEEMTSEEEFSESEETADTQSEEESAQNTTETPEEHAIEPLEPLENLPEDAAEANGAATNATQETAEDLIIKADKYRADKDYVKAIETYKTAAERTDDVTIKAQCYENTATVYAIVKRYGSAMSYAQQAYNMAPSTSRELLLARLYYKTGEVDKATRRVNNILQRDFSIDK